MLLKFRLINLPEVDSTNTYLKREADTYSKNMPVAVYTNHQTEGMGQHQNIWHSEPGSNMILSLLIYPDILLEKAFYLSKVTALAVKRTLDEIISNTMVKWTNDIIVDDKKIAGILIDNNIKSDRVSRSIIGIGLNVNQQTFPSFLTGATSLWKLTRNNYVIDNLVHRFLQHFADLYETFLFGQYTLIDNAYNRCLYKKNCPVTLTKTGEKLIIHSVDSEGYLKVHDMTGAEHKLAYAAGLLEY